MIVALLLLLLSDVDPSENLASVKRIYVEKFGGGESAAQIRDMVIASIQKSRLFVLTENPDRADAILRGSAEDLIFTDVYQSGESIGARGSITGSSAEGVNSRNYSRNSIGLNAGVTEGESSRIQERKHEASASLRLVNRDGDIVWSTTQESQGAKFRSASADVADKVARQLAADYEKLKIPKAPPASPSAPARSQ
jgi:hypothetical protein